MMSLKLNESFSPESFPWDLETLTLIDVGPSDKELLPHSGNLLEKI